MIVLIGLLWLWATSGMVVWSVFRMASIEQVSQAEEDTGTAIGKVENLLILLLMILEAYTALGVIFAAKAIVRREDMGTNDTSYYITGTLANFTYSVLVGAVLSLVLEQL